ncbi:MAG: hypothetical protein M0Z95_04315 [Actinomycetota bacterium]|jgi:DNA-binding MarR family transcriptional regulator|nr:hypothetical protein [Actinomycetota bacterium]
MRVRKSIIQLMLDCRDLTHIVRDLPARSLVTRRPDPRDRRQSLVEGTPAGGSMLDRLDLVLGEVQTEVFAALTASQRRTLLHLLQLLS